jgi:hypothetical protein
MAILQIFTNSATKLLHSNPKGMCEPIDHILNLGQPES